MRETYLTLTALLILSLVNYLKIIMLIEFKVTNFRSINSTQTLSMVAAPIKEAIIWKCDY